MIEPEAEAVEVERVVGQIGSMRPRIDEALRSQSGQLADFRREFPTTDRFSQAHWVFRSRIDSLRKLKAILPPGPIRLDTMGVLALTRYVFEMTVWLKLISKDQRYGLTFYRQLIANQRQHLETTRAQYLREIEFLRGVERKENNALKQKMEELFLMPKDRDRSEAAKRLGTSVMGDIDRIADRSFSIYAADAKVNGYGFQAYRVETEGIPKVEELLRQVDEEEKLFLERLSPELHDFTEKDRKWSRKAIVAGMKNDYDYIYSYTSRLLHAEPASISTNQQNLEPKEMLVFLRYVRVCIIDILEICAERLTGDLASG